MRRQCVIRSVLAAVDALVIVGVALLSIRLRQHLPWFDHAGDVRALVLPVVVVILAGWMLALAGMGAYNMKHVGAGTSEYRTVLHASGLSAGLVGIAAYLFDYPLSRGFFFLLFSIGPLALLLTRHLLRRALHSARRRGALRAPILIAGSTPHVEQFAALIAREPWLGYDAVGALLHHPEHFESPLPVLGTPDDVLEAVRETGASAVVFVEGSFVRAHHFNHLARLMEEENAAMIVIPSLTEISSNRVDVQTVAGTPLLTVAKPQAQRAGRGLKRGFDLVVALIVLVVASPLMAATAIAIKIQDGGPIIFTQPRVGRRGRPFNCLKFRSMVTDAEKIKQQLLADDEGAGVLFKLRRDPRVTPLGRILRRFSIDELPQLWNVLRGDMSLVGPRPALESEVARYKRHVTRRLAVRPGITGLWQVSGRSDLSWDDTVRLDLYYVDNWSFVQDLTILARTVMAVLRPHGAY